jgi:hypothetical protein
MPEAIFRFGPFSCAGIIIHQHVFMNESITNMEELRGNRDRDFQRVWSEEKKEIPD